jgi:aspartate aminotransferase
LSPGDPQAIDPLRPAGKGHHTVTHLSKLVQSIEPSPTLSVDATARRLRDAGREILSLGAGQPDFPTPPEICEAAIAAIRQGVGQYTAVEGTSELRQAIVTKLERDNGLRYSPDRIVVSNGAKHSLYNLMLAAVEPGDGVLLPVPYWVSYPAMVKLAGGEPQYVEGDRANACKITPASLEARITPSSRVLVLNSPCNPSGAVYTRAELVALAEVVRRHDLLVITDEIYEKIVYDGTEHVSFIAAAPDRIERSALVNGVSKTYAMTGWRIGYLAAPRDLAQAVGKLQGQSTGNASAAAQAAAAAALGMPDTVIRPMLDAYAQRRAVVVERLRAIEGIDIEPPAGSFYAFPRVDGYMSTLGCQDSMALAAKLLEEAGVAVVPGEAFGSSNFLRLSFATGLEVIEAALRKMAALAGNRSLEAR